DEYGTAPAEMPGPLVTPRMEQPYDLLRHRVNAGKVGTLVAVVEEASQRQVPRDGPPPVTEGEHVVDLEGQVVEFLWHPAVFAAPPRPCPHQVLQGALHASSIADRVGTAGTALQGGPGLGLEDPQQAADAAVGVDLVLFLRGQGTGAGFGGQ